MNNVKGFAYSVEDNRPKQDVVNHPAHYTSGAHECIDVIQSMLSPEEFKGFLKGNIFKYRFRSNLKNGEEDIKKAEWYETKLMEVIEKESYGEL